MPRYIKISQPRCGFEMTVPDHMFNFEIGSNIRFPPPPSSRLRFLLRLNVRCAYPYAPARRGKLCFPLSASPSPFPGEEIKKSPSPLKGEGWDGGEMQKIYLI